MFYTMILLSFIRKLCHELCYYSIATTYATITAIESHCGKSVNLKRADSKAEFVITVAAFTLTLFTFSISIVVFAIWFLI